MKDNWTEIYKRDIKKDTYKKEDWDPVLNQGYKIPRIFLTFSYGQISRNLKMYKTLGRAIDLHKILWLERQIRAFKIREIIGANTGVN